MVKIKTISLDDDEVVIQVGNQQLVAMIAIAPYSLAEGCEYDGELTFYMFGDFELEEADVEYDSITHIKNFSYRVTGKLIDTETIDVGFPIKSEWLEGYSYLIGQYVSCEVDRLEVNFI